MLPGRGRDGLLNKFVAALGVNKRIWKEIISYLLGIIILYSLIDSLDQHFSNCGLG